MLRAIALCACLVAASAGPTIVPAPSPPASGGWGGGTRHPPSPIDDLVGTWKSADRGWNMIALPLQGAPFRYRLLMNQYEETLTFFEVDKAVPNRGINIAGFSDAPGNAPDQLVHAIDYEQVIHQIAVEDFPFTNVSTQGPIGLAIHHENGLWLHMRDERTQPEDLDIARSSSIPHGQSVLAHGNSRLIKGPFKGFDVPFTTGLPLGVTVPDILPPVDPAAPSYLDPYRHFVNNPFFGVVPPGTPGFPGFNPANPEELLTLANQGVKFRKIQELEVDTTTPPGGINNLPFIIKQAHSSSMKSTFWIQELEELDPKTGKPKMRLQYLQVVMLDFFGRRDGLPGRIAWPHVSINTLEKVA